MALLIAGSAAFAMLLSLSMPDVMGASAIDTQMIFGFNAVGLVVSLGMWRLTKSDRFDDARMLDIGLAYQVSGCFALAFVTSWVLWQIRGHLPALSLAVIWILLQPVVVPSSTRRAALGSFASAAMIPLALVILGQMGVVTLSPMILIDSSAVTIMCAGLAVYAGRIVNSLTREVSKAEQLGSYQLESRLGEGGMGEVWRARHGMLARPAAVKLIRGDALVGSDPGDLEALRERFEQEARVTARLRSPHTVEVFDFGETDDGRFYYVMELLDGIDLRQLVKRDGPQPPSRVVHILRHVCHSLAEAHAAGLVHRDIKPANISVCRNGLDLDFVKVLDFGLVRRHVAEDTELTATGMTLGTPAFMAPEMARSGDIDGRADLYGLGCVAYTLLTGGHVFEAKSPIDAIVRHARDTPVPPSKKVAGIPAELDEIILACLAKDRAHRPADAPSLSAALAAVDLPTWTSEDAAAWWARYQPAPDAVVVDAQSTDPLAATMAAPADTATEATHAMDTATEAADTMETATEASKTTVDGPR